MTPTTITLQSNDGHTFVTELAVARRSGTIRTMLDAFGFNAGALSGNPAAAAVGVVPLPNVCAAVLQQVLTWAQYHCDDPPVAARPNRPPPTPADAPSINHDPSMLSGSVHDTVDDDLEQLQAPRGVIRGWDLEFVRPLGVPMLCELMRAACYLDMPELRDLGAKGVAMAMRNKTTPEMAVLLNIKLPEEDADGGGATNRTTTTDARKRHSMDDNMWESRRRRLE